MNQDYVDVNKLKETMKNLRVDVSDILVDPQTHEAVPAQDNLYAYGSLNYIQLKPEWEQLLANSKDGDLDKDAGHELLRAAGFDDDGYRHSVTELGLDRPRYMAPLENNGIDIYKLLNPNEFEFAVDYSSSPKVRNGTLDLQDHSDSKFFLKMKSGAVIEIVQTTEGIARSLQRDGERDRERALAEKKKLRVRIDIKVVDGYILSDVTPINMDKAWLKQSRHYAQNSNGGYRFFLNVQRGSRLIQDTLPNGFDARYMDVNEVKTALQGNSPFISVKMKVSDFGAEPEVVIEANAPAFEKASTFTYQSRSGLCYQRRCEELRAAFSDASTANLAIEGQCKRSDQRLDGSKDGMGYFLESNIRLAIDR